MAKSEEAVKAAISLEPFQVSTKAAALLSEKPQDYPGVVLVKVEKAAGQKSGKVYYAQAKEGADAALVAKIKAVA